MICRACVGESECDIFVPDNFMELCNITKVRALVEGWWIAYQHFDSRFNQRGTQYKLEDGRFSAYVDNGQTLIWIDLTSTGGPW